MELTKYPKLAYEPFTLYGSSKDGTSCIMYKGKLTILKNLPIKKLQLMSKACSQQMNYNLANKISTIGIGLSEPFCTWIGIINTILSSRATY